MPVLDADVGTRRLLCLHEALTQLERPQAGDPSALLADPVLRAAVERWIQVAVECCVDLAFHVVAAQGWTPPDSARHAFRVLAGHQMLPDGLAARLGLAAGLRNLLVHDYADVDLELLAQVVREDLGDLRAFAAIAGGWIA